MGADRGGSVPAAGLARGLVAAVAVVAAIAPGAAVADAGWRWPLRGTVATPFAVAGGPYAAGQHRGIDVAAPAGTPVVAATAGRVRFAGVVGSAGLTVSVRTADGRFDTAYLHLATATVRAGQDVAAGARIGTVGASGSGSLARPHLHFGVRDAGTRRYRDPLALLPPAGAPAADGPHAAPVPVRRPLRPRTAPQPRAPQLAPQPSRARPYPFAARAPRPAGEGAAGRGWWAVACVGLIGAAVLAGGGSAGGRRLAAAAAARLAPSSGGR